ncbi:hypothetical protein [Sphingomonas soli]|uniref:hypothetical protein n=1 Tax=Sphingomonas soli TaxID=266127 RepID=UPI000A002CFB|nr:hypothetical protein [Sphingomonas soli]
MALRLSRASVFAGASLLAMLSLGSCGSKPAQTVAAAVVNPCGADYAALSPALPMNIISNETQIDCFAWASFVALNWQADPAKPGYPDPSVGPSAFGTGTAPLVWETYKEAAAVFGPVLKGTWQDKRPAIKVLTRTSKTGDLDMSDITQAGGGHHWLTSQRGDITYYEVMMNRDEFEFITSQPGFDLTTAAGQLACAMQPGKQDGEDGPHTGQMRGGLVLPEGPHVAWDDMDCAGNVRTFGDSVGAMELKASWIALPADGSLNYRYKTALAELVDPVTKAKRTVTVGLTGLHIARKRFPMHQWTWATFEHIDNSPDEALNGGWSAPVLPPNPNQKPSPGYTFFNPQCDPKANSYKCVHNAPPVRCTASQIVCNPYNAPMQITRLNPVPAAANGVTAWFWSLMPAKSVFNYYRLVNVQWPQTPGNPQTPGEKIPLNQGNPKPAGNPNGKGSAATILSNTTMESFAQGKAACMDCHVFASIATPKLLEAGPNGLRLASKAPQFASDYSFIFETETKR